MGMRSIVSAIRPWDGEDRLLHQLLEPAQGAQRRPGMNGADAAGMSGPPRLEDIQSLTAADLTNGDTIRSQSERRAHQIGK